ncbi:hypothetical protein V1517DRAFT_331184 [Lipomyces orientalis]|uniref:Uncharacterized protein n=1 Tax=Lipomyces orientalis TaxID=1233043 RepID=A0ACC3TFX4_9ASCO
MAGGSSRLSGCLGAFPRIPVIFSLRIGQTLLDIILFGLAGWLVSNYYQAVFGFTIFLCIATLLDIFYQVITPQLLKRLHNKTAVLVLEGLVTLWWFCVFVSSTALYFGPLRCNGEFPDGIDDENPPAGAKTCSTINSYQKAVIWFALIQWCVFIVSLVLVVRVFIEYRRDAANVDGGVPVPGGTRFARDEDDNPFSAADYDSRIDGGAGYTYQGANGSAKYGDQYEMTDYASPYDDGSYEARTRPYSGV